jgi:hypothetical protein
VLLLWFGLGGLRRGLVGRGKGGFWGRGEVKVERGVGGCGGDGESGCRWSCGSGGRCRCRREGKALCGEGFHDDVPSFFEGLYALFEFFVLCLLMFIVLFWSYRGREGKRDASAEGSVLVFEFCYSTLKIWELSFTAIAGVLCSDAVAMCTSFLAVFVGIFCARTFARGGRFRSRSQRRRIDELGHFRECERMTRVDKLLRRAGRTTWFRGKIRGTDVALYNLGIITCTNMVYLEVELLQLFRVAGLLDETGLLGLLGL